MTSTDSSIKAKLEQKALDLGFDAFGVAAATRLDERKESFTRWIEKGRHGSMAYMERNIDKRLDPRLMFEGTRSVIMVAQNYFPKSRAHPTKQKDAPPGHGQDLKIAKYAWGEDYHFVMREKLAEMIKALEELVPGTRSRAFTDSAPVLERAWAEKTGIGRIGKNSSLIIPRKGSFFFLGGILTTLAMEADEPFGRDLCGSCTRCMEACPTNAITAPGLVDARRCISYLTIELKGPIPGEFRKKCQGWVFGCDICQDVCPHNRWSVPHREPRLNPLEPLALWSGEQWRSMQKNGFKQNLVKAGSPLSRVKFEKLLDNMGAGPTES
ncbi:MAG: tRNA epoxyqueuosine(34) reductase QueG [Bacteroidales bacterium]